MLITHLNLPHNFDVNCVDGDFINILLFIRYINSSQCLCICTLNLCAVMLPPSVRTATTSLSNWSNLRHVPALT